MTQQYDPVSLREYQGRTFRTAWLCPLWGTDDENVLAGKTRNAIETPEFSIPVGTSVQLHRTLTPDGGTEYTVYIGDLSAGAPEFRTSKAGVTFLSGMVGGQSQTVRVKHGSRLVGFTPKEGSKLHQSAAVLNLKLEAELKGAGAAPAAAPPAAAAPAWGQSAAPAAAAPAAPAAAPPAEAPPFGTGGQQPAAPPAAAQPAAAAGGERQGGGIPF